MGTAPAGGKHCAKCGEDVSQRARIKDGQGRYFCQPCVEKAKARKAARQSVGKSGAAPDFGSQTGQEGYSLDEPDLRSVSEDSVVPVALRSQAVCPKCEQSLTFDAVICTSCGHNRVTGHSTGAAVELVEDETDAPTAVVKHGACGKCGYALKGIQSLKCPECGAVNRLPSKRDEYAVDSRRAAINAYLKPTVLSVIGLGAAAGIYAAQGELSLVTVIAFVFTYILGVVVYFLCSITFVGVDQPFHLLALQLLAVYGIVECASAATLSFSVAGAWKARLMVVSAVHAISLMTLTDIEYEDAWIVALLTLFARVMVWFGVLYLVANQQLGP